MGKRIPRLVAGIAACLLITGSMVPVSAAAPSTSPHPPRIIIDSDMALWWDDVEATAMANALQNLGKVEVLGVVSDVKSKESAAALDVINTYYGNGDIPVGATLGTAQDYFGNAYTTYLAANFPHKLKDGTKAPEAVALYRELLSHAPDHSVTVISIGGLTNLAALLTSPAGHGSPLGGRDLVAQKVTQLVIMAGQFPVASRAWTNELIDTAASKYVVNGGWPTKMIWVDANIGFTFFPGATVCAAHTGGPVRATYDFLFGCGNPVGDASWDPIAIYYAVFGLGNGVLSLTGAGGAANADFFAAISWKPNPARPDDRYIVVNDYPTLTAEVNELLSYVPTHRK
jgi:inosine-uridine nucleoside N-ribohydrolase